MGGRRLLPLALAALAALAWRAAGADPEIPPPAPRVADGAWAAALQQRPRLLGPGERLRALAREKPEAYRAVRSQTSLLASGVVHAVDGIERERVDEFIAGALRNVARGPTNRHQDTWTWMQNVALTYDFFHAEIPPEDRRAMVDWLNAHLEVFTTDENAFHNSTLSKILCYLRVAYATWGENPRAPEFRDYALRRLYEGRVAPVLREFGDGGGFTEGGWYQRSSLWNLVQALELARRVEGYDGFQQVPRFFYQRLAYELFQPYPGLWLYGSERYPVEGDGSRVYGSHNESPRHLRTLLAQYFRGSELARAVANRQRRGSNPAARFVDFLWEEEPDPPLDLAEFPLSHLAAGVGKLYARSHWEDDATWLRFECGPYFAGHQHFEAGAFEIFRREPLATNSGEYASYLDSHSVNWLIRTIAHNSLLVYREGEEWPMLRDGGRHKPYANDGGQAQKWEWTVGDLPAWLARRQQYERGEIVAYQDRPEFLYAAADPTAAYDAAKLALWTRQIVFLRPHAFVIFDRVRSVRPEDEKTWLMHVHEEPEIAGRTVTAAHGDGRLIARALLPEDAVLRKVEGYTYGGRTFAPNPSSQTPVAPRWRLEVRPGAPREEDLFLHVLFTDEPQPTELRREGGRVGVRVGEAEVWFSGEVGGSVTLAGRRFPLEREVRRGRFQ